MSGFNMLWVARTSNRKTDDVPTAYVGVTIEECRASCEGCALLDGLCYAWSGMNRPQLMRMAETYRTHPERYSLAYALTNRDPSARIARISAMGDPARAKRDQLWEAVEKIHEAGLRVLSYTHFWREEQHQDLRGICMASCEDEESAATAWRKGWKPALVLPWDHRYRNGVRFQIPDTVPGVVCPAYKDDVTCNACRMCAPSHPVWEAGKISGIGFVDHSRAARRIARAENHGLQLPLFDPHMGDIRPQRP